MSTKSQIKRPAVSSINVGENQESRKKPRTSFSGLKTLQEFQQKFPLVLIDDSNHVEEISLLKSWNLKSSSHKNKVIRIMEKSSFLIGMTKATSFPPVNESGLYPYIHDLLKIIIAIRNHFVPTVGKVRIFAKGEEVHEESLTTAVTEVAKKTSSSASRASLTSLYSADQKTFLDNAESSLPESIDATDPEELKKVYIAIEKQLQADGLNTGHVEFALQVEHDGPIKAVVESKRCIINNQRGDAGFYQICAEMVASQSDDIPIYGILTDHQSWLFLKLENNLISLSDPMNLYTVPNKVYGDGLFKIMFHLLEILDIPPSIDVDACFGSINESIDQAMNTLLRFTRQNANIEG
jgi:hypothetical protein